MCVVTLGSDPLQTKPYGGLNFIVLAIVEFSEIPTPIRTRTEWVPVQRYDTHTHIYYCLHICCLTWDHPVL